MSVTALIQTFEDAYVDSSQPDVNFADSTELKVGRNGDITVNRAFFYFDLSFIPIGSKILSSNLSVYIETDESGIGQENKVTPYAVSGKWVTSEITWNNQPSINGELCGASANLTEPGYYSWTVTILVDQWVNGGIANNGLVLKTEEEEPGENKGIVSVRENTPERIGYKPVLVIHYTPGRPISVNIDTVVTGFDMDSVREAVTTSDTIASTITRNTSDKTLVSYFVNNLTPHSADVGIEVSTDGVNFLREKARSIPQGVGIYIPSYYAAYSRLYYKSTVPGEPTTLSIDYVAQA